MFSSNTSQVSGGYEISRSLRFNSADSAYLNRTPASAGNRRTWTWSGWVKRSDLPAAKTSLFSCFFAGNDNSNFSLIFDENYQLSVPLHTAYALQSSAVYRDPSAWYHIVCAVDTTQATATNRIKLYVNGVQITAFATNNLATVVSQNMQLGVNAAQQHTLGRIDLPSWYFPGYMTEVNFIDGQALTPSSFGAFDAQTGVWGPKAYAGSYGTNGFYLNFSDNSNTTAATLGRDYSGNSNNWTPNNFSVSAGVGNDSLVDVPTNWGTDTGAGGNVRGNYATLNPLQLAPSMLMSNGNLYLLNDNSAEHYGSATSTIGVRTGKWYAEFTAIAVAGTPFWVFGIARSTWSPAVTDAGGWYGRWYYTSEGYAYRSDGKFLTNNTVSGTPATYGANDVIGVAIDLDSQTIAFYKNGVSQGTPFTSIPLGIDYVFAGGAFTNNPKTNIGAFFANFGQRPFAYTAPSGFKALNTQNLPTPTIGATTATQAGAYFTPSLFAGAASANITVSGLAFQPSFVWFKARSAAENNIVTDAVRGGTKYLITNLTNAEGTASTALTFNSDGYTVPAGYLTNGVTYVGWAWRANGAGSSNTAGSITSTVSANTTSGFSVVTYTGNGTSGATLGHGLNVAPSMIIVKNRSITSDWFVGLTSIGWANFLKLNAINASASASTVWNNTAPSSTVFTIGNDAAINNSGNNFVAYCFAEVPGYSRFGSYTGNGSSDGVFVFTGMRPAYLMVKRTDTTSNWTVLDFKRLGYNVDNNPLYPNLSDAEGTTDLTDLLSNGFKLRSTDASVNASGGTYIFAAFAEAPQKFALAR